MFELEAVVLHVECCVFFACCCGFIVFLFVLFAIFVAGFVVVVWLLRFAFVVVGCFFATVFVEHSKLVNCAIILSIVS